ncbi:P-loop containing nucleoside triphosphate hydrolase protein [Polychytrium aggregatum]|uniref:P-loop containing nucleoside triphosphate hydrolase protein n=1 Tax=Polychytrium aggregatum TaxID=110093 RepID=UPI0022FEE958|nr:P-loop containing nucleoside triphosphate hydrolase protein [Polychytrium aggregatum]KAI9205331.1 P-loop containing nucleoside triphosphate hydrolase protein [Polychytrium aggregatum]
MLQRIPGLAARATLFRPFSPSLLQINRLQAQVSWPRTRTIALRTLSTAHVRLEDLKGFQSLALPAQMIQSISSKGIAQPTLIQERAIPVLLEGKDAILTAETGSGKTLAYLLPILARMQALKSQGTDQEPSEPSESARNLDALSPTALFVVPSRHLAIQLLSVIQAVQPTGLTALLAPFPADFPAHQFRRPDIVVTSPTFLVNMSDPQLKQFFRRVEFVVIDEADTVINSYYNISLRIMNLGLAKRSPGRSHRPQYIFAGATLPPVKSDRERSPRALMLKKFPGIVTLGTPGLHRLPPNILELFVRVSDETEGETPSSDEFGTKLKGMLSLLLTRVRENAEHEDGPERWIVFCNSQHSVEQVHAALTAASTIEGQNDDLSPGWLQSIPLHAGMPKAQKDESLATIFGQPQTALIQTIVSSDVYARGMDFADVSTVVNFDFPNDAAGYVHRAGRTGRAGRSGEVISFVTKADERLVSFIEAAASGDTSNTRLKIHDNFYESLGSGESVAETSMQAVSNSVKLPLTGVLSRKGSLKKAIKRKAQRSSGPSS